MSKDKTTMFTLPAMRGKIFHKYIVQKVAERLISFGFQVSAEHPIRLADGSKDYIDLFVTCCAFDLLIEIETTVRNVLSNAAKANELGLRLWIITPNKQVSSVVLKTLGRAALFDSSQIRIFTLGQFLNLSLAQIIASWKG